MKDTFIGMEPPLNGDTTGGSFDEVGSDLLLSIVLMDLSLEDDGVFAPVAAAVE